MRVRVVVLPLLLLTACEVHREGDKVTVEMDASEAKAKAKEAGAEIREGAHEAGAALNAGKQELDIRTALALDETIDRTNVAIAVDETTRTIRLHGTVPTADQSARVEATARSKAEGWTIVNQLGVAAPTTAPVVVTAPAPATATAPAP